MKLPRRLTIAGHRWRVIDDRAGLVAAAEARGWTHPDTLTIAIDTSLAGSMRREVLLHEVIHASIRAAGLEEDTEETVARALAPVLLAALRDNPPLARYLLE